MADPNQAGKEPENSLLKASMLTPTPIDLAKYYL